MTMRVAVIGAGVAGLVTAKSLLDEGMEPVVFDKGAHVGGLWFFDDAAEHGGGPAYRSLRTNISRHTTGFSDFPMPDSLDEFPSHTDMHAYLESYARAFDLLRHIRLSCPVQRMERVSDGWSVATGQQGAEHVERFDAAVVCTGRYQAPHTPAIPGAEAFEGRWMHSREYVDAAPFAGKRVLVVGTGASGADIAVEVASVAEQTFVSSERGAWFIPLRLRGKPYDHSVTRLGSYLPLPLRQIVFRALVTRAYRDRGIDLRTLPMPLPPFDMKRTRLTPSDDMVPALADGTVRAMPGLDHVEPDGVVFTDGRRESVDAVILATGYHTEFPFLPEGVVRHSGRAVRLYRHVFAPRQKALAFVGMTRVIGPHPPVLELQARWAARVLAGAGRLPDDEAMERWIDGAVRRAHSEGVNLDRVQHIEYMDELANEIGCRPRPWRHPRRIRSLLFGPMLPAQYRLEGPGQSSSAVVALDRT